MSFGAILLLAVGLAMDATAAAAARGLAAPRLRVRDVLLVAGAFGGFQALMPVAGWLLGRSVGGLVAAWDHWIAFVLLAGIGIKTIREALGEDEEAGAGPADPFAPRLILLLAVATSIDALAVGVTLPLLGAPLLPAAGTIGLTTALLSAAGLFAGRRFGARLGSRLEVAGGLVLIALGVKILLEHLAG